MIASPSNPVEMENASSPAPTAADVMAPISRTCSPFSTVTEAVMVFKDENTDMIPVVDAGKLIGVVVDRGVALAVADVDELGHQPVTRVMTRDVPMVAAEDGLDQVVRALTETGSRWVLVVDPEGSLLGIVTRAELTARTPIEAAVAIPNALTPPEATQS